MSDYTEFAQIVTKGGPAIIVVLLVVIFLLVTNRLMTRRQHETIVSFWKFSATDQAAKIGKLLDNDDITHALLRSIVKEATEKDQSEEDS